MSDNAIRVEHLFKQYDIGLVQQRHDTLRDALTATLVRPFRKLVSCLNSQGPHGVSPKRRPASDNSSTIWALKDVSFEVMQGAVMGLIGRNGAGKSTLLKILSRITEPTSGFAEIHGRVGSLLEVGTGFHPELSGRENIYLNGSILGMKRAEIGRKLDEIVAFAEVERFIDTPVKHYSSGMYLRLAFAVAAHLEPEILLVDEVLAVGDIAFQRKCLGRMEDVAKEGRTVLFVSHNMSAILRLCSEAILLDEGRIALRAPSSAAVEKYLSTATQNGAEKLWRAEELPNTCRPFRPIAIRVRDASGTVTGMVRSSQPFSIEIEYQLLEPVRDLAVKIKLYSTLGELLFISWDIDELTRYKAYHLRTPGYYVSRCHIPANLLNRGSFVVGISVTIPNICRFFSDEYSARFAVDELGGVGAQWAVDRGGFFRPALEWDVERL
jgi:lipopolysaccharide transport system ATP-binding protein